MSCNDSDFARGMADAEVGAGQRRAASHAREAQIDTSGAECVCGPDTEAVFRDDGSNGWVVIHHSLDGREAHE